MHMPDYSLNVSTVLESEQEQIISRILCQVFFFSFYSYKIKPLCRLQIFNIMAFDLLNLQIKWPLRGNCSAPWHGDCHHPASAFLQRVI